MLPHPWLLVIDGHVKPPKRVFLDASGSDTLVIGPPHSIRNYEKLNEALLCQGIITFDIILKKNILSRDSYVEPIPERFWSNRQVRCFQSTVDSDNYFFQLKELLSRYDRIVAPYFSSLVVFAKAMGKEVFPLLDYDYLYYENFPYEHPPWDHVTSSAYVNSFLESSSSSFQIDYSRMLLGADLNIDFASQRQSYLSLLKLTDNYLDLKNVEMVAPKYDLALRTLLAVLSKREGIMKRSLLSYMTKGFTPACAGLVLKNDWVFYASGGKAGQTVTELPFIAGLTEPGSGAECAQNGTISVSV